MPCPPAIVHLNSRAPSPFCPSLDALLPEKLFEPSGDPFGNKAAILPRGLLPRVVSGIKRGPHRSSAGRQQDTGCSTKARCHRGSQQPPGTACESTAVDPATLGFVPGSALDAKSARRFGEPPQVVGAHEVLVHLGLEGLRCSALVSGADVHSGIELSNVIETWCLDDPLQGSSRCDGNSTAPPPPSLRLVTFSGALAAKNGLLPSRRRVAKAIWARPSPTGRSGLPGNLPWRLGAISSSGWSEWPNPGRSRDHCAYSGDLVPDAPIRPKSLWLRRQHENDDVGILLRVRVQHVGSFETRK